MIKIKNAKKKFRKVVALDDVSINVEIGKITALLGVNGVGKSTILKAIMGLIKLDEGDILIDGKRVSKETYNKLAFVPDILHTYRGMTIKESFEFMNIFYENWHMEKAYDMLKKFELEDSRKIDKLSKGNIARVKLILGFAQNPKYLLLDEPFSGIDIFTREKFITSLINYMDDDMAILLTTHEIKEIENLVDQVILMDNGKIVETFNVEEVKFREGLTILEKMKECFTNEEK